MDFNEAVRQLAERISALKDNIATEEATKMSLIVPMFSILGYDVFNPLEFCPEYVADVGIKKGEKVDYAILDDGKPTILIECKSCHEKLTKHGSQLFRYFGTTSAKFGILTNGIQYRFYTDLEEMNKMDIDPFLEIDMLHLRDNLLVELKKFCKDAFDKDKIFSTAEDLKYTSQLKAVLANQMDKPSDAFVRFMVSEIYDAPKTQKVLDKFAPLVKKSFSGFVNDLVNQKISAALTSEDTPVAIVEVPAEPIAVEPEVTSKIVTTQTEIEAFYIVRGVLADVLPVDDITYRDTESYFGILFKNNSRKPICRFNFDTKVKQIMIPNEDKSFQRFYMQSLNEIYTYKEQLAAVAKRYL